MPERHFEDRFFTSVWDVFGVSKKVVFAENRCQKNQRMIQ